MKTRFFTIALCILFFTACTSSTDATLVAVLPPTPPKDTPLPPPLPIPSDTLTPGPQGDIIIVTNTSDSGPGSLRDALEHVQSGATITFDPAVFSPDAPATILVMDELPHLHVNHLTIDASNAGVIIDGSQISSDWIAGLQIVSSDGNKIIGLQISHFPGPGIAISGASHNNIIGGDRNVGDGPWGQGNLLSNNIIGIDLATSDTSLNTVTGNLIGTDLDGTDWLGNEREGVFISEGAHDNTIGPDNIIANNGGAGIYSDPEVSLGNTDIQNDIYDNGIGKGTPPYPVILDFNLSAGTATGATCPNCMVEIFSTGGFDGEIFEDQTTADENGVFAFNKGESFVGPYLTARATHANGLTSEFSWPPTSGAERTVVVQEGNNHPRTQFLQKQPTQFADNHIATQYDGISYSEDLTDMVIYRQGVTRARVSMTGLEPELVDWDKPEFSISQAQEDHFNRMADKGIIITYVLVFWDKESYPGGDGLPCYRFKTEEEIEHWLEYVRFIVENLKDRVTYFEIWNEPDIPNYCPKSIELPDYINLIKRTVPVIREIDSDAKIVVGATSGIMYPDAYNYLLGLLRSDVMPEVDVISWHPMYGVSPELSQFRNYYYDYPDIVQEIKETATASGFVGEYHVDELTWRTEAKEDQPGVFTQVEANKYFLQSAIMHRGMDIDIGLGSGYYVIRRLSTAMAGVEPAEFPVEIESTATDILSYTFSTPDGSNIVGLWRHGKASEFDPGVGASVTIPDFSASRVVGIDVLDGFEQELIFEMVDGNLVISGLMVKDYPILIKLSIDAP